MAADCHGAMPRANVSRTLCADTGGSPGLLIARLMAPHDFRVANGLVDIDAAGA